MARYDDYRSSTGTLDTDRSSRFRGPPVLERERERERPRRVEEERFESRLRESDRFGPPARRSGRHYEDDHLTRESGALMSYNRGRVESPPPRPRLLRRQSSLDTFDRIPSRKLDEYYLRDHVPPRPVPLPRRRRSPLRYQETDYLEDIRIAEPDYYGDEEYRAFYERDRHTRPRRSGSHFRERSEELVEKPYPRKGKTRIPRKLVHTRAIIELGYPYHEEDDVIILGKALSKGQIDEVIGLSREIKRTTSTRIIHTSPSPVRDRHRERHSERITMERSPRSSGDALMIIEASPSSRHRSRSRHYGITESTRTRTVSRARSISVHGQHRRRSSPVRIINRDSDEVRAGPLVMVRPRDSDEDIREYMQLERRHGGTEIIRDTEFINGDGDVEEILETKRERKSPNPRLLRAMMATLT